jgi:Fe-S cluster biogenesis protein NfuA
MDTALRERIARVETLVNQMKESPAAIELVQTLLEVHYAGIDRMMEIVSDRTGDEIIDLFAHDEVVGTMLLLHDLHPIDVETRVTAALDSVRPYLHSHGGNVELLGVANGVVRIRLAGSCDSCPSSTLTLKTTIETAIHQAAPDIVAIETT